VSVQGSLFTPGFQSFVAWRYLLTRPRRISRFAAWIFAVSLVVGVGGLLASRFLFEAPDPRSLMPFEPSPWQMYLQGAGIGGCGIAFLALFFGLLRLIFTFFTTVPIGGVWIGTAALVCVLSVMAGFESDLRVKILGSNAHVQVTRDGAPFTGWEDVKARIDAVPGVVASMPYATSEAVISANSSYSTVIVKGVQPEMLGQVTRLGRDLQDPAALRRMAPLVDDELPTDVAPPSDAPKGDVRDPAPTDMPGGADPIDFSRAAVARDAGAEPEAPRGNDDLIEPEPLEDDEGDQGPEGDSAQPVRDPVPDDFDVPDEEPADLSKEAPDAGVGSGRIITIGPNGISRTEGRLGPDDVTMSKRTASLPGVLVGRELVKQIHLYTGQEVRLVSPLSDPSNPDATGTPIPYNRDYRVAGVFYTGMYEYDLKFVYVPLDSLQDFLDMGDAVEGIEIRILDPESPDEIAAQLRAALGPGYTVKDWQELNRNLFSALKLEKIAMFLVLAIIILVASFSIVGNLIMVVMEKSKEIALLKTLGASNGGIMMLFVTQGFFIGLVGTSLGVAFGLLACWAGKTYGLPLNPDVYYIDKLPIHIDPLAIAAVGAAGIVISVAATLYPAFLAGRLQPAVGLRHE
jgi:lipoprotein-releasing system permease protein